jgi:outer membrane protein assembly factor BamB/acyl-CoA synthetase (AMP-forming)/AMP-acid ligase II
VVCEGHAPAELLACIACLRVGAPFVPLAKLSSQPLSSDSASSSCSSEGVKHDTSTREVVDPNNSLSQLLADIQPTAAIITASSENHPLARTLRVLGVHRLLLLQPDGSLVLSESDWTASLPDVSSIPLPAYRPDKASEIINEVSMITNDEAHEKGPGTTPLLYVLFTSGTSSGGTMPKGVMGTQEGLINRLIWQYSRYPFRFEASPWNVDPDVGCVTGSVVCRRTPLVFVDSVVEIFGPILAGVPLYAPPSSVLRQGDMFQLATMASRHQVTHCTMLPSQLDLLCSRAQSQHTISKLPETTMWPTLQVLFVSGESCSPQVVRKFHATVTRNNSGISTRFVGSPSCLLVNLYGSTEVAGDVCCAELTLDCGNDIPIGTEIIPGNYLYVARRTDTCSPSLQDRKSDRIVYELVPDGDEGELLIGGAQVCKSYLGAAAGTIAEKFVVNPFKESNDAAMDLATMRTSTVCEFHAPSTVYCTGDLVRVVSCGSGKGKVLYYSRRIESNSQTVYKIHGGIRVCLKSVEISIQNTLHRWKRILDTSENYHEPRDDNIENNEIVVVTVASVPSVESGHTTRKDVLVACVLIDYIKEVLPDLVDSDVPCASSDGRLVSGISAALRQVLLNAGPTYALGHPSQLCLPTIFFPVSSFSLTTVPGKYNRSSFRKQVQFWVDQLKINENDVNEQTLPRVESIVRKRPSPSGNAIESVCDPNKTSFQYKSCQEKVIDILLRVLPMASRSQVSDAIYSTSSFSFFALGGDSIAAIECVWLLKRTFFVTKTTTNQLSDSINNILSEPLSCLVDFLYQHLNNHDHSTIDPQLLQETKRAKCDVENNLPSAMLRIDCPDTDWLSIEPPYHWFGKAGVSNCVRKKGFVSQEDAVGKVVKRFELVKKWRCAYSKCIDGTPILVEWNSHARGLTHGPVPSCLYVGSHNGEIACMDQLIGVKRWQRFLGVSHHIEGALCFEPFMTCEREAASTDETFHFNQETRSNMGGIVYAASYIGQDVDGEVKSCGDDGAVSLGRVWALCAATGEVVWHSHDVISGEVKGSPAVLQVSQDQATSVSRLPIICVGSHDGCLYAFHAMTGALLNTLYLCKGALYSSPVPYGQSARLPHQRDNRLLVTTTGGWVVSIVLELNVSGEVELLMSEDWSYNTIDNAPVFTTPVVFTCPTYCAGGTETLCAVFCTVGGDCICLDARNGTLIWSLNVATDGLSGQFDIAKSSPIFSSPCLFPLQRHASFQAKSEDECTNVRSTTTVVRPDVGLAFGCHDGCLRFVSCQLGQVIWKVDLHTAIYASPSVVSLPAPNGASPLIAFVATTSGELISLSLPAIFNSEVPDSKGVKVVTCSRLPGEVYSSPVVAVEATSIHCDPGSTSEPHEQSVHDFSVFVAIGCRDDSVYAYSFASSSDSKLQS